MNNIRRDAHEFTVADRLYGAWDHMQFAFMNLDKLESTWNETRDGMPFPTELRHLVELSHCLSTLLECARQEHVDRIEV